MGTALAFSKDGMLSAGKIVSKTHQSENESLTILSEDNKHLLAPELDIQCIGIRIATFYVILD